MLFVVDGSSGPLRSVKRAASRSPLNLVFIVSAAGGRLETRTPYRKGIRIEILRVGAARNRHTSF